ncbi:MAG TPA: DUF1553 domain-containing protein, partial [Planctomycetaceae bacterium]|nr:DUF1553 domain-containing protein [Planctomycetaceae bacterium]
GRATLLRRLMLDLTGLPPAPEDVDEFLADDAPHAWEKVVDRLLASPRYGERMAITWLDLARYADTSGYQSDGPRDMWRWRDWVIAAFNADLPYDRFTAEQIAGDLLPGATLEQQIATGFNRNHRGNAEGGIVPEEYEVEYVVDRVDTTATVFLGLTLGCARCHDHKFDPFTQREFYGLFAYFNNIPEHGRALKEGNSPPYIKAPTIEQQQRLDALRQQVAAAERAFTALEGELEAGREAWERSVRGDEARQQALPADWAPDEGLLVRLEFEGVTGDTAATGQTGSSVSLAATNAKQPAGHEAQSTKHEAHVRYPDGPPEFSPGVFGRAARFDGRSHADAGDVARLGYLDKLTIAAWVRPERVERGTIVSRMTDRPEGDGYAVTLVNGRVQVHLVKRWLDDSIRVEAARPVEPGRWQHVAVTYDGSRLASGLHVYIDGEDVPLTVHLDYINQSFANDEPLRIGAGGGPDARFDGLIDDVRIYADALPAQTVWVLATPDGLGDVVQLEPGQRSPRQAARLRAFYLAEQAPDHIRAAHRQLAALRRELQSFDEQIPTVMVMQERETPRPAFVLERGQYDQPGAQVPRGVPASLPPLPTGAPDNRLGFARWLVDPSNPLTARVAVNRAWHMHFGAGLVKTMEDFGAQGEPPSHPELLDWLACEFRGSDSQLSTLNPQLNWSLKRLHRLIVTSAAYRQSSRATPELVQRDPENRLLARGPRFRLSAEVLRDQALAASGLLVERLGGPSVKPYQPAGLWQEIASETNYEQDHGEALYRRGLYTFWKRTVAPPTMATFDAPSREACTVNRPRTNTPLQALALLNDVTFVEAARVLAERVLREAGPTARERLSLAFRLCTGRPPRQDELRILLEGLEHHRAGFRSDPEAAEKLLSVGEAARDPQLDPAELAAYATLAGLLLNLDEVVTRE